MVAETSYVPTANAGTRYSPRVPVTAVRSVPVSVLRTFTSAPGSTAPLGSLTVPRIVAVFCAATQPAEASASVSNAVPRDRNLFPKIPLQDIALLLQANASEPTPTGERRRIGPNCFATIQVLILTFPDW